jgi:Fur family transcriptional regulator, ferric uptake regulator
LPTESTTRTNAFDSADSVLRSLRDRGLRISMARRLIVNFLFDTGHPVSAQQIVTGLDPTPLDLASVYRNLETLEDHGVVHHFHAGHGPGRYALIGDSQPEYLVCDRCGAIEEIERSELEPFRRAVRKRFGYEVGFTHFPMMGVCPRCAGGD